VLMRKIAKVKTSVDMGGEQYPCIYMYICLHMYMNI
jgi:hypothetical protein